MMDYLIRAMKLAILICMATLVATNTARSNEICPQATIEIFRESLPCHLKKISWVEASFQGKILEENKSTYEKLIRLRLRNDLSMIKHEVLSYTDAIKKYEYNSNAKEIKEKGSVSCFIWTVGDDYPVAILVECELWGYGNYTIFDKFTSRILGFSSASDADSSVRDSIREIIADISGSFLERRDLLNK